MRDENEPFDDDCGGWTEASFIRRFAELPANAWTTRLGTSDLSPAIIFELATHGKVADLQYAVTRIGGEAGGALPRCMPDLFSTVGMLQESWKSRQISFGEAIRGLFTIREVVQNLESGRSVDAGAMHFFGAGLVGVADGEQHLFGAQIVAEKLYVSGWRTEVNVESGFRWLIERASAEHFDFVGVSVGSDELLAGVADRIAELRQSSVNRNIDVIVGGAVFAYSGQRYDFLGADHVASTADDAIRFLNARVRLTGASLSH